MRVVIASVAAALALAGCGSDPAPRIEAGPSAPSAAGALAPDCVDVEQVAEPDGANPSEDLRAVQDRIGQDIQAVIAGRTPGQPVEPGLITGTGVRDPINRVTVMVFEPDDAIRRDLSERYGADRICLEPVDIPEADDAVPSPWEPAPGADLSPTSTSIDVLVHERDCASGDSAEGRIPPPTIEYRPDAVVITIGVIPKPGGQDCPSNPDTPFTIELDEPLGDRELLDGRSDPPAPPTLDAPTG